MEVRDFVHQQQAKHWMQSNVIHHPLPENAFAELDTEHDSKNKT